MSTLHYYVLCRGKSGLVFGRNIIWKRPLKIKPNYYWFKNNHPYLYDWNWVEKTSDDFCYIQKSSPKKLFKLQCMDVLGCMAWMYVRELYSSAISSFSFICVKIPGAGGNVANLYNLIFIMTALSLPAPHHYYLILSIWGWTLPREDLSILFHVRCQWMKHKLRLEIFITKLHGSVNVDSWTFS